MAERQDHNRADALDAARTEIKRELRRYERRLKSTAEAKVNEMFDHAQATGLPFDYAEAARRGVEAASVMYFAGELPAAADVESGATPAC